MKIYKTQEQVEKDIKNGVLAIEGDVKFECSISIDADIVVNNGNIIKARNITAWNIYAENINALNITAGYIYARDITAGNINATDITAWDINAGNITAWNINAIDIYAWNINARDITAGNISYHAFCCVYRGIKCKSIKSRRNNAHEPICLEGKLEIEPETLSGKEVDITIDGKTYKAIIKE